MNPCPTCNGVAFFKLGEYFACINPECKGKLLEAVDQSERESERLRRLTPLIPEEDEDLRVA